MSQERIYTYKRYERFWHWSQAALIVIMMISGFEVHGSYNLTGFEIAVRVHTLAAWALLTLWAFTIFWQFTTGEWRQYIPSLKNVDAMIRYYVIGIFKDVPHPFRKSVVKKHNPLQRLAYLALLAFISPVIWGSGLLYLFYAQWPVFGLEQWLTLDLIAAAHTLGAYLITAFFFIHVYLTTTGHTVFAHIKAMITGWEDMHEHPTRIDGAKTKSNRGAHHVKQTLLQEKYPMSYSVSASPCRTLRRWQSVRAPSASPTWATILS